MWMILVSVFMISLSGFYMLMARNPPHAITSFDTTPAAMNAMMLARNMQIYRDTVLNCARADTTTKTIPGTLNIFTWTSATTNACTLPQGYVKAAPWSNFVTPNIVIIFSTKLTNPDIVREISTLDAGGTSVESPIASPLAGELKKSGSEYYVSSPIRGYLDPTKNPSLMLPTNPAPTNIDPGQKIEGVGDNVTYTYTYKYHDFFEGCVADAKIASNSSVTTVTQCKVVDRKRCTRQTSAGTASGPFQLCVLTYLEPQYDKSVTLPTPNLTTLDVSSLAIGTISIKDGDISDDGTYNANHLEYSAIINYWKSFYNTSQSVSCRGPAYFTSNDLYTCSLSNLTFSTPIISSTTNTTSTPSPIFNNIPNGVNSTKGVPVWTGPRPST